MNKTDSALHEIQTSTANKPKEEHVVLCLRDLALWKGQDTENSGSTSLCTNWRAYWQARRGCVIHGGKMGWLSCSQHGRWLQTAPSRAEERSDRPASWSRELEQTMCILGMYPDQIFPNLPPPIRETGADVMISANVCVGSATNSKNSTHKEIKTYGLCWVVEL